MIPILHEHCLNHIFSYLKPHDLVKVSEVCQFWKQVAKREWKKITEIENFESLSYEDRGQRAIVIPVTDAKKIVTNAAQYIDYLGAFDYGHQYYMFGKHPYKVEGFFDSETILKLLTSANATKITVLGLRTPPDDVALLTSLFETNKITTLHYVNLIDYHQHIPTDGIENLCLDFFGDNGENLTSLKGYFPNLKQLSIFTQVDNEDILYDILTQILPHVLGLTCLNMTINPENNIFAKYDSFNDIFNLLHLEKFDFCISGLYDTVENGDTFFANLRKNCPKLRILRTKYFTGFTERSLQTLMSLPDLELLDMVLPFGFDPTICMEFQDMKNLSSMKFMFFCPDPTLTGFPSAIRKMPNLKRIELVFVDDVCPEAQYQLACDLLIVAASQGKEVLFTEGVPCVAGNDVKVVKTHNLETSTFSDAESQTLDLIIEISSCTSFLNRISAVVEKKLYHYKAIIVDRKARRK